MAHRIAVLAHNQPVSATARTHVKREVAVMLVARLCAEQITQRVIRMFPPSSSFPSLKASQPDSFRYIPEELPAAEVSGCIFRLPNSPQWRELHVQLRKYRIDMAYLTSKALGSISNNSGINPDSRSIKPISPTIAQ